MENIPAPGDGALLLATQHGETTQWPRIFHFGSLPWYLRSKLGGPRLAPCGEVTGSFCCPPSLWLSCFVVVHVVNAGPKSPGSLHVNHRSSRQTFWYKLGLTSWAVTEEYSM